MIQDAAYIYQPNFEAGRHVVVVVDKYTIDEKPPEGLLTLDPAVQSQQNAKLKASRSDRDKQAVRRALKRLQQDAQKNKNLMPSILQAVEEYVTLGEICRVLRQEFGEHRETIVL